ncbi:MAG: hypothetical protein IKZ96_03050 [Bacilli bacterium]|nr:hypothetical protein [Bacilli bacterium]
MEQIKKGFWKTIDFIYKHKVIAFFVAFTLATSLILYGVFATDDEYENKLKIRDNSAVIKTIADAGAELDADTDTHGKDASASNGVLRNFDSISYNVEYVLEHKTETLTTPIEGRTVIVDVIIPKNINATLTSSNKSGDGSIIAKTLGDNYSYFHFEMHNVPTSSTLNPSEFDFTLEGVNTQTVGASFTPIILVKESTDADSKSIDELTPDEKEAFAANPAGNVTCPSTVSNCLTTMTGTYDYNVEVYQGTPTTDTVRQKTYPIGVAVKVPRTIGVYIPNSVSFSINWAPDVADTVTVQYAENSMEAYKGPNKQYTIMYDGITQLPELGNTITFENNVLTVNALKYSSGNDDFVGTASFELKVARSETDRENRTFTVATSNLTVPGTDYSKLQGGDITVTDYYEKFVGSFLSQVDIYAGEVSKDPGTATPLLPGNAYLNYNQRFRVVETIAYATDGKGDDLSELDNYIKIDPTAFLITKEDSGIVSAPMASLKYGQGEWTSEYFDLTGVSGCPTSFDGLTTENIMNLYGGPCIVEKTGENSPFVWSLQDEDTSDLPIIIVKAIFGDQTSDDMNADASLTAKVSLAGKIRKNNINLIDHSYQISTLSTGYFKNPTTGNLDLYYLSKNINTSDVTSAKNPNNYGKSNYSFENRFLIANNTNPCNGESLCGISGDTVHVMGFKVNKPEVVSYFNNYPKTSFYDYPIEWRIQVSATSDIDTIEYDHAGIAVTIPKTLNYLYAEILVNNGDSSKRMEKTPSRVIDDDPTYTIYVYDFERDEITNGAVNTLSIFTDIFMNTKSGTQVQISAAADMDGYIVDNSDIHRVLDNRPSIPFKTTESDVITLYNSAYISTFGNAAPRYVEKEESYTYTMKSYNNSSDSSNAGYAYENATLYYMLPYIEDYNYKSYNKKFTNSTYKVKINDNLTGYTAYYTTDASANVVSDVNNLVNSDNSTNWVEWTNPSAEVEATAIKIVKNENWDIDTYFVSENGVNVTVTPVKNAQADAYYNGFIVAVNRPAGFAPECEERMDEDPETPCDPNAQSSRLFFYSSESLVEVYSRQISGFVFEDYNYSDIYEVGEDQMKDIVVELYKLNNTSYDPQDAANPNAYINSEVDELVSTTTTDGNGAYTFTGLNTGNYYVLFRYDGNKYTPSNKYAGGDNSRQVNSKSIAKNQADNEAVSDILTLTSQNGSENKNYINLGLRIRKDFAVEINKYITNIVQTSSQGVKTYEYEKATKVNIDIRNIKNTKFRVTYSFDIVNTKYFPGYIGIIADLVPAGMTFDGSLEENKDWTIYDGVLYYTGLQDKLLLPGDRQYFKLVLDLDTNTGGTYTNIVAAQQPILMGEKTSDIDFNSITFEDANPVETTDPNTGTQTGTDTGNNTGEGNNGE